MFHRAAQRLIAGAIGGFYVVVLLVVTPASVFGMLTSAQALIVALFGTNLKDVDFHEIVIVATNQIALDEGIRHWRISGGCGGDREANAGCN